MLDSAARLGARAAGDVEPNPLVGCIIGRVVGSSVEALGAGHHRRFGGPHAEAEALQDCHDRGRDPRGATAWITLEPCNHTGKTPPCAEALIRAGVARVVIARADGNALASGGAETLRRAGVEVAFTDVSPAATRLSDPFHKRIRTGLPWVIAKWAQTIDGRIATRTGESQWISCAASRRRVHRLRARVDAILTGIGTVKHDDPQLTARDVRRVRREARRIIIDPRLELSPESNLARTARDRATIVVCSAQHADSDRSAALERLGVVIRDAPSHDGVIDLAQALRSFTDDFDMTNVLVESGPGLLGRLIAQDLVDEASIFIAPLLLADSQALPVAHGVAAPSLLDGARFEFDHVRMSGKDAWIRARRTSDTR